MAVELGTHQLRAVEELDNGKVLRGGVGTGKSRTAIAYYLIKECGASYDFDGRAYFTGMARPKDLYIITTAKKRDNADWYGELAPFGLGRDPDFSLGHTKITVDSWNNIAKYRGVKNAFFIFDEQRLVGSGAWVKSFLLIAKQNNWILLSATPGDTWMDFIPVFVANGFYKNRTEFIRTHVVYNNFSRYPKIDHYVEVRRLVKYRNQLLVEMPYARATVRNVQNYLVDYDKDLWERVATDRWNVYENRPIKDIGELFRLMRMVVNKDLSRYAAILQLLEKHPRLIVFYNFNYELEMLRTLGKTIAIPYAEWNGHRHEEIPDTDNWLYMVQYTAGAEGWNCITTDAMAFWSLPYSYKVMEQAKGRIDRLNTTFFNLYYYILRSAAPIDKAIARALVTKEKFQESKYAHDYGYDDLPKAA